MTAPDTQIEKQVKRHRPSLIGIAVALAIVVGLIVFWVISGSQSTPDPTSGVGVDTTPNEPATAPPSN